MKAFISYRDMNTSLVIHFIFLYHFNLNILLKLYIASYLIDIRTYIIFNFRIKSVFDQYFYDYETKLKGLSYITQQDVRQMTEYNSYDKVCLVLCGELLYSFIF